MANEKDAIKIANREVDQVAMDLRDLDTEVEKGNREGDEFRSILKESGMRNLASGKPHLNQALTKVLFSELPR